MQPASPAPSSSHARPGSDSSTASSDDGRVAEADPVRVDVEEQMLRGGRGLLDVAAQQWLLRRERRGVVAARWPRHGRRRRRAGESAVGG